MIPASDVKFLRSVITGLKGKAMSVYSPGGNRSAAAIILRFGGDQDHNVAKLFSKWDRGLKAEDVVARLEQHADVANVTRPSELRILFLKRADIARERWSGHIAFPGGRRDPDDTDDFTTVRNETYEEVGIPLDSPEFIRLGRLPDFVINSRHLSSEHNVQARFVFLHIGDLTPSVKLARHEVESVQWCPLDCLSPNVVEKSRVVHHLMHFVPNFRHDMRSAVQDLFPNSFLHFPSVGVNSVGWRIWGLTLRTASELVELDGRPTIDWPFVRSTGFFVQHFVIDAFHGYCELTEERFRGRRFQNVHHLWWLLVDMFCALLIVYVVAASVYAVSLAVLFSLELVDFEDQIADQKQYWKEHPPLSLSPYASGGSPPPAAAPPSSGLSLSERELSQELEKLVGVTLDDGRSKGGVGARRSIADSDDVEDLVRKYRQ